MASPQKTFFWLIPAAFLGMVSLFVGLYYYQLGAPTKASQWAYEINMKKLKLAREASGPKVLLIGGSSTLFGLSAEVIEKETGLRTINLGTHAALGGPYILDLAKKAIRPGDTALLSLEYELYAWGRTDVRFVDALFLDYIVSRDPDYFLQANLLTQWNWMMQTSWSRLRKGLKARWNNYPPLFSINYKLPYDPALINDYGDQTGAVLSKRPDHPSGMNLSIRYLTEDHHRTNGLVAIWEFCQWARSNQVRVLATWPCIAYKPQFESRQAEKTSQQIREFYERMEVPMVGTFQESLRPPEEFFDTVYHMAEETARERTRRLLPDLVPYLEELRGRSG